MPTIDDVIAYLIDYARTPRPGGYSSYGYGFYLPNVITAYLREVENNQSHDAHNSARARELSPVFFDAAWELCRRGILRPGIIRSGEQATADGASGNGYTVTAAGRQWISDDDANQFIAPGRLNQLFAIFAERLGPGFLQRAQEATKSYSANAFLACCAMCGAAAESILLAVTIEKRGDEQIVLRQYRAANGRRTVIESIVGPLGASVANPFRSATNLLGYWRDEASHGIASQISEIEAHEAIARLLRFAQFVVDEWDILAAPPT